MLVVGADTERLGRLAGPLVGAADGVSLEFLAAHEAAIDRLSTPDADCIACEVTPDARPGGEFLAALHEAARSVPVVLFGEDGAAFESVEVETTDAVIVEAETESTDGLLSSVEAAVGGDRRPRHTGSWYGSLLASTSDVVLVLDGEGTIEYATPSVERVLGYDPEAVVGDSVFEYVDGECLDGTIEEVLRRSGPSVAEFELERADGETRIVDARGHDCLDAGPIAGHVVSVRDVTDRRRRGQDLAEYERIIETAPIGLTTIDPDGRIAWANEVYAETLDIPRAELFGMPFLELVETGYYEPAVVEEYFDRVRTLLSSSTDADRADYEVRTHLPDGETLVHDVHTALLPLDDGGFDGTVSAFRDVTTQRAYERELERQNERLDAFASVVSHDIRNPLSVAEAYLDIAMETGDRDTLETVADAHGRIDALVDDLLTLARHGRAVEDPTPTDITVVARRAWTAVETEGATLNVEDAGTVRSDPARLQQGFENLFRNAVEHGAVDGQDLTVTVGPLEDGRGFFVADDGRGIPADERECVFEHGYTADPHGTGFGLTIVETIAEAHGWSIAVVEGDDGGACFEVTGVDRVH